ncbi:MULTISPECIES: hypothetical protein [Arcobacteraceae]|uniref:hypothetical protein n=1 Tax=Arcobacteraceae TaxID=2808963 RepID=UPI000DEB7AA3|nr:hypothetical protein [Arcobacter sp. CECT 9188]RBQ26757.1 hypothetical protein CRU88_06395 [Arcobacter sp. CECT 9188]
MAKFSFLLIGLGLFLILLQIYVKIDIGFDDRFWGKKSSKEVLQERIKMDDEGKLNWFWKFDLFLRKLMNEKLFLKVGVILIFIGLILNILF